MEVQRADRSGEVSATLTEAELVIVNNALNQVCNGLSLLESDGDFRAFIGVDRHEARAVLREVGAALRGARGEPNDETNVRHLRRPAEHSDRSTE